LSEKSRIFSMFFKGHLLIERY